MFYYVQLILLAQHFGQCVYLLKENIKWSNIKLVFLIHVEGFFLIKLLVVAVFELLLKYSFVF
jgi:hypothetical protein